MNLKIIIAIVLAVGIGYFLGSGMYKKYNADTTVFKSGKEYYFITAGSYEKLETLHEKNKNFKNYAYENKDGVYKVYVGISSNKDNIEKIKGLYKDLGKDLSVETKYMNSSSFTEVLSQYDMLLEKTDDPASIETIVKQVLEKFKELEGSE